MPQLNESWYAEGTDAWKLTLQNLFKAFQEVAVKWNWTEKRREGVKSHLEGAEGSGVPQQAYWVRAVAPVRACDS